jgi:hypothetical protein
MSDSIIDSALAKKLGAQCFNATWDLIAKQGRSSEDIREMIVGAHASLWLWKRYDGHTPTNISIGLWQISRVYSLANDGAMAVFFGEECVETSKAGTVDPFYLSYGYEAMARGLLQIGDKRRAMEALDSAELALKDSKEEEIADLRKDLEEFRKALSA